MIFTDAARSAAVDGSRITRKGREGWLKWSNGGFILHGPPRMVAGEEKDGATIAAGIGPGIPCPWVPSAEDLAATDWEILPNQEEADLAAKYGRSEGELVLVPPALTLRDQFAMAALTGYTSDPSLSWDGKEFLNYWAETCYRLADAMMEARKK